MTMNMTSPPVFIPFCAAQFLSHLPDEELLSDRLFSCISNLPMLSRNRKWSQVSQLTADSVKEFKVMRS